VFDTLLRLRLLIKTLYFFVSAQLNLFRFLLLINQPMPPLLSPLFYISASPASTLSKSHASRYPNPIIHLRPPAYNRIYSPTPLSIYAYILRLPPYAPGVVVTVIVVVFIFFLRHLLFNLVSPRVFIAPPFFFLKKTYYLFLGPPEWNCCYARCSLRLIPLP